MRRIVAYSREPFSCNLQIHEYWCELETLPITGSHLEQWRIESVRPVPFVWHCPAPFLYEHLRIWEGVQILADQTWAQYVYWRVGLDNEPACAGGFLRCDHPNEVSDFVLQCKDREITHYVKEQT